MSTDGDLRRIFQKFIPEMHAQSVETFSTGQGVPDMNYCLDGKEGWIEMKATTGWKVKFEPHQVGWIERRGRAGGRVLIAVRRKTVAGPRRGSAVDQLWMFPSRVVRQLATGRIDQTDLAAPWMWDGGPSYWNWDAIRILMRS